MVTKSCKIFKGSQVDPKTQQLYNYTELDIDLGGWGVLVKKAVGTIIPGLLKRTHFCLTLTVQGETDDELPERAISSIDYYKIDASLVKRWPFKA